MLGLCVAIGSLVKRCHDLTTWIEFWRSHISCKLRARVSDHDSAVATIKLRCFAHDLATVRALWVSSSFFSSCKALHGQRHYYALCGGACCYFSSLSWDNIYFTTDPSSMPLSRVEIYVSSAVVAAHWAFSGEELPELEIASTQFQGSFFPAVLFQANSPLRLQVAVVSQRSDQAELLFAAIEAADAVAVNSVLARGQCPNALNSAGTPPLYAALNSQSEPHPRVNTSEIAAMLIAAFADVPCRYDFGGTALHLASRQCLPHIIPDLLRARADVNALDSENDSPLHTAAIYGTLSCVELLLHSSANPRGCNLLHETPLTCACAYGSQPGVVSLLMAAASPSNWTSVFLMSLHHVALMLGKGPADLFSTCRALSHQSGNCLPCHGGSVIQAGATSLAGRPLWCDTRDSPTSSEAETSAASPAGSPLLTCDTALQCHMCVCEGQFVRNMISCYLAVCSILYLHKPWQLSKANICQWKETFLTICLLSMPCV